MKTETSFEVNVNLYTYIYLYILIKSYNTHISQLIEAETGDWREF